MQPDFIPVAELAERNPPLKLKTLYNSHSSGSGPFSEILVKVGGRLGCWRADYDLWLARQRRLTPSKNDHRTAA